MPVFTGLFSWTSFLYMLILLCLTVGGFAVIRFGYYKELMARLKDTNEILMKQIEALTLRVAELEKREAVNLGVIDTITQALSKKNIKITIDGEMVTLTSSSGVSSSIRPRIKTAKSLTPAPGTLSKKDLEQP